MKLICSLALVALVAISVVSATDGGDISEYYSSGTFACCRNNGWDFVIVRSYCSYGGVDPNAGASLAQARDAGIPYRDIYHFPCAGVDAHTQVADDFNNIGQANFGMMWFDIETNPSSGCGWSGDLGSNCNFLGALISAGHSMGIHMGIYASAYMWSIIMGDGCSVGADNGVVLWYAHYDYTRSFSDFSPFGGWSKPNIKQYNDGVGMCGISADADWYP
jgi:hypothetical protein